MLGMVVEVMMVVAAFGFGGYAIYRGRKLGKAILDLLGLRLNSAAALDLLAGFMITAAAMLGIYAIELSMGAIVSAEAIPSTAAALASTALIKLAFTIKEELIMRSLLLTGLLFVLKDRRALAIGISAVAFGLIHLSNPGSTPLSILGNSLGGVIYGLAFVTARNLWLPIGLHFGWNFVQGPLLGFPVSGMDAGGLQRLQDLGPAWLTGGAYGPEAGVVGFVFRFVIIGLVLLWVFRFRSKAAVPAHA